MHDHNLDDLIIDNIEPKNSKTKSFLTIIALMIVILIVAIILTKILLKTPDQNRLAYEEDTTELIAPELQLKETPKPQKSEEEPSLSNVTESKPQAPVVETKKERIEPSAVVVQKEPELSNLEDQEVEAPVSEAGKQSISQEPSLTIQEKEAKDAADIAYWKQVQEKRKNEQIAYESKEPAKPTITVKEEAVKPKPVVTSVTKPAKPVASKPVPKTVSTGRYYVQVGAYRQQPSKRFMSVIQNNGYKYIMTKPNRSGIKRLLIGPYMDRESVNRALIEVRDRIHKQAFITTR